tara:strand:+ start:420 stop:1751 length:1332 start_codon:yes stop_codon:yes gene_type:complete
MEEHVLNELSKIIDPDLNNDIVSLNFIKNLTINNGNVSFTIELTTPACPVKDMFKKQAEELVSAIKGVKSVTVTMGAQAKKNAITSNDNNENLQKITSIIAISSCKGGVGKSSMAVNLAYCLKENGGKVGIFDADVYGPSLPTMIRTEQELIMQGNNIRPIDYNGIKCMSFGYALDQSDEGPAILRGPMVTQIIGQFLTQTAWGDLDYLIIDMPPGTGDIPITLCQLIPLTAAVIVTTPQHISFIDVVKGIEMFDNLKVPVVGVIENMSYLEINNEKHYPFGQGALRRLIHEFGFKQTLQLELNPAISACADQGTPFVEKHKDSQSTKKIKEFTNQIIQEISIIKHSNNELPQIGYNKKDGIIIVKDNQEHFIPPKTLRLECQSALSRDEFTGEPLIQPNDIPDDIYPVSMNPVGNYALGINWSDGHASLFPYETILDLCKKQ